MPDISSLQLFVIAALVLAITPGPAVMYIVTRSITQGRTAGIVSCLGITTGGVAHVLAAALGLSAALATSAMAFNTVKYAGAAYLLWLGVRTLATRREAAAVKGTERHSLLRIYRD